MNAANGFPEPIRIFSDLHLGHPGSHIASAEQLRPLLEGAGTAIFNGDTVELRAKAYRADADRLYGELERLTGELGLRVDIVTGNHDPAVTERHHMDLCAEMVLVTHGDVLFPEVAPWSIRDREARRRILALDHEIREAEGDGFEERLRRCKQVCELTEVFKPRVKPGLLGRLRTLVNLVWPPWKPFVILHVWWRQKHLAADFCEAYRPQARCFVFGHTHYPGVWSVRGRIVVNTGGYVSMGGATMVEIEKGELRVYAVRRGAKEVYTAAREPSFRVRIADLTPG